jgi:hypothetical protein
MDIYTTIFWWLMAGYFGWTVGVLDFAIFIRALSPLGMKISSAIYSSFKIGFSMTSANAIWKMILGPLYLLYRLLRCGESWH